MILKNYDDYRYRPGHNSLAAVQEMDKGIDPNALGVYTPA